MISVVVGGMPKSCDPLWHTAIICGWYHHLPQRESVQRGRQSVREGGWSKGLEISCQLDSWSCCISKWLWPLHTSCMTCFGQETREVSYSSGRQINIPEFQCYVHMQHVPQNVHIQLWTLQVALTRLILLEYNSTYWPELLGTRPLFSVDLSLKLSFQIIRSVH